MRCKPNYLYIFFILLQIPLHTSADPLAKKKPEVIFNSSTNLFPLEKWEAQETASVFSMSSCMEKCKRKNQMVSTGIEVIMAECQYECKKKQALQKIKSNDLDEKNHGIRQFCLLAEKRDVPELIVLLKHDLIERTGIWAQIIPTLGRLQDIRAVPLLKDILLIADDDWLGREMTAQALGEIGDTRAVPVLIQVVWSAETRDEAIAALAKINDERATEVLVSAVQPDEESQTQKNAAKGLVRLGASAVKAIMQELNNYTRENPQSQKRIALCQILGAMQNPQAKRAILDLVKDSDEAVRKCAQKIIQEK